MELYWVSVYACINKHFFLLPTSHFPFLLPSTFTDPCINHFYCFSHISLICNDSQQSAFLFGCIRQACVADNYHWVSQWELVNVFVVRGDHVLKHLLTFQHVGNSIWGFVCGVFVGKRLMQVHSLIMTETTLHVFKVTLSKRVTHPFFLFVCVSMNESKSQWVSWTPHTWNESVLTKSQTPTWKALARYLSDIIVIIKTYGSTGRGLTSIKSVLTRSVPEQHNTMTHPLGLAVIGAMHAIHSCQKVLFIFKMLIK